MATRRTFLQALAACGMTPLTLTDPPAPSLVKAAAEPGKIPMKSRTLRPGERPAAFRARLLDKDTYATTLLVMALDQYGMDVLSWTAETIRLEFFDDFQVLIHQSCLDKLMAAAMTLTTDEFYQNLPRFIQLCNAFSSDTGFDPFVFDPADCTEMAWAITEAYLLAPPDDDEAFSDEIREYIGFQVDAEGLIDPPDVLALAIRDQPKVDPMSYESRDPAMYAAVYEHQQTRARELKEMLHRQLQELFAELESLPLRQGDATDLLKKLRKSL